MVPIVIKGWPYQNLLMEQLISHILTLLLFRSQLHDPTRHLLQANIKVFCLETTLSGHIFWDAIFDNPTMYDMVMVYPKT